jgi:hypothetical protein
MQLPINPRKHGKYSGFLFQIGLDAAINSRKREKYSILDIPPFLKEGNSYGAQAAIA